MLQITLRCISCLFSTAYFIFVKMIQECIGLNMDMYTINTESQGHTLMKYWYKMYILHMGYLGDELIGKFK